MTIPMSQTESVASIVRHNIRMFQMLRKAYECRIRSGKQDYRKVDRD